MDSEMKSAQAYQVIGYLWGHKEIPELGGISESEWMRALDYFANANALHEDFLPWPKPA